MGGIPGPVLGVGLGMFGLGMGGVDMGGTEPGVGWLLAGGVGIGGMLTVPVGMGFALVGLGLLLGGVDMGNIEPGTLAELGGVDMGGIELIPGWFVAMPFVSF